MKDYYEADLYLFNFVYFFMIKSFRRISSSITIDYK